MDPPVLDRGLSRKRARGACAPCDCCANSLALTRGLPEGLLPNRFLFLCRIGELEGLWSNDGGEGLCGTAGLAEGWEGCGELKAKGEDVAVAGWKGNLFGDCGVGTAGCGVAVKCCGRGVEEGKDCWIPGAGRFGNRGC